MAPVHKDQLISKANFPVDVQQTKRFTQYKSQTLPRLLPQASDRLRVNAQSPTTGLEVSRKVFMMNSGMAF